MISWRFVTKMIVLWVTTQINRLLFIGELSELPSRWRYLFLSRSYSWTTTSTISCRCFCCRWTVSWYDWLMTMRLSLKITVYDQFTCYSTRATTVDVFVNLYWIALALLRGPSLKKNLTPLLRLLIKLDVLLITYLLLPVKFLVKLIVLPL